VKWYSYSGNLLEAGSYNVLFGVSTLTIPLQSFTKLRSGVRCSDRNCYFHTGNYRASLCCESIFEESSAGNPYATSCGNRRRVTASGDPVVRGDSHSYHDLRVPTAPCFACSKDLYNFMDIFFHPHYYFLRDSRKSLSVTNKTLRGPQ
jgi:hypothetical protein